MHYRTLGKTGITVSEIGFGAWGIGGATAGATSYGKTDDRESRRALRRAFELGVSFYDTSNIYGDGHSESLIGEVFRGKREKVVIATKGGMHKHKGIPDLSPKSLRASLEGSLRRLRTDFVDLYQLHAPPLELLRRTPEAMKELCAFKKEGKTRAIGFSVKSPEEGIVALRDFGFDVVQVNYNLVDQRAAECGLFTLAEKIRAGVIARTPLCFGFLSGNLSHTRFNSRDHRSVWHTEQRNAWQCAVDLFSTLNKKKQRTMVQLALQFCLALSAVSTVVPGILHSSEAAENAATSALPPLTAREQKIIRALYESNTFFRKDLKPQ